jgi:RNA recognition motif-containing protein
MSFTVFLGNLPVWVTADDIKGWLTAENLVADAIKVIRNPETQESKGFAFIDAPNTEEMNAIIRRFDRAPLEDRLLRANPAQPPKPKGLVRPGSGPGSNASPSHAPSHPPNHGPSHAPSHTVTPPQSTVQPAAASPVADQRPPRRHKKSSTKRPPGGPQSAFAEELSKAL